MATPAKKAIPDGMHTLTPHIVCEGASDAIAFYRKAFNAEELTRLPAPGGKVMHAAIRIGDSVVMLMDDFPEWGSLGPKALKGSPVTLHLFAHFSEIVGDGHKALVENQRVSYVTAQGAKGPHATQIRAM